MPSVTETLRQRIEDLLVQTAAGHAAGEPAVTDEGGWHGADENNGKVRVR